MTKDEGSQNDRMMKRRALDFLKFLIGHYFVIPRFIQSRRSTLHSEVTKIVGYAPL